jgi:phenazine biosynthesis protein phzE
MKPARQRGCLLDRVLSPNPPPFALLYRPAASGRGRVDVFTGDVVALRWLADIPLDGAPAAPGRGGGAAARILALIPYRQVCERGYECRDDGEPILVLNITEQAVEPVTTLLRRLPQQALSLVDAGFDIGDDDYAGIVRNVIVEEIGRGAGSNFVVKRTFAGTIPRWSASAALTLFRHLLADERGAYWTFVVHTGERTFVGATPERHLSVTGGLAVMNPISGTYRYPAGGPTAAGLMDFLLDRKEIDELQMVVDEELKMMACICDSGGRIRGPYLKEMARLAHTEYLIEGRSSLDVREMLRITMFAPAVTGSPIENACRVLARHERTARGFYGGVIALAGHDGAGEHTLDSAILIRTADVDGRGGLRLATGATLVRHSDPASEVAETKAKAATVLAAAGIGRLAQPDRRVPGTGTGPAPGTGTLSRDPAVIRALTGRNATLAPFWFEPARARAKPAPNLAGRTVLVVDAEDTFTAMLGHVLRAIGPRVRLQSWHRAAAHPQATDRFDVVILGPGPGDPADGRDPRVATLRSLTERLLSRGAPLVAVCLSHQVLAGLLGLSLVRKSQPSQGLQREIDLFGSRRLVGFYNAFAAVAAGEFLPAHHGRPGVRVSRDHATGEVHALLGPAFASVQFHPESVLTRQGPEILTELLRWVTAGSPVSALEVAAYPGRTPGQRRPRSQWRHTAARPR